LLTLISVPVNSQIPLRYLFAIESPAGANRSEPAGVGRSDGSADRRERVVRTALGAFMIMTILLATMVAGCGQVWSPSYAMRSLYPRPARRRRSRIAGEPAAQGGVVKASWYGASFSGRRTASGERFDPNQMTAASKTLPLGSVVHVTNLENGRSVTVRINDRGPYVRGRSLDLSHGAANRIGLTRKGVARVKVTPVPARSPTVTASMLE
jgi:3D (Asp-Asp-Asp) domain-containing protein